jgi:hypothetical protein
LRELLSSSGMPEATSKRRVTYCWFLMKRLKKDGRFMKERSYYM